jgi:hypothetical protein
MMHFLKVQLEFLGLTAPAFSWVISALLILYAIYTYGSHRIVSRNRRKALAVIKSRLVPLRDHEVLGRSHGLSERAYRALITVFDDFPFLGQFWCRASSATVARRGVDGKDCIWLGEDVRVETADVLDHDAYKSAPTLISGVGLLATFLAILVALLDVRLTHAKVQGLDLLVQGLSGKFLSSVVAVTCATVLTYGEKRLFGPLESAIAALNGALQDVLPRLTPVQIMSDIGLMMEAHFQQVRAFQEDTGGGPGVSRMVSAVDSLSGLVRSSSEQNHQVMSELTAALIDRGHPSEGADRGSSDDAVKKVLSAQIDRLAAISDTVTDISDAMSETLTVLKGIGDQVAVNNVTLISATNASRSVAIDYATSNQGQIEHLTEVVADLMAKLHEKTEGSLERSITAMTTDMSFLMRNLSTQLADVVEGTSRSAAIQAKEVLDTAGSLASRNTEQVIHLLERHGEEVKKVESLNTLLDGTLRGFVDSIGKYQEVTDGLRKVTSQMNAGIASFAQIAKSVGETQKSAVHFSTSMSEQLEFMKISAQQQHDTWARIGASMGEYDKVFEKVEYHARDLLSQIARHLSGYSNTTEKHFVGLTTAADDFIARATGRLSGSIEELSEQLEELHGTVAKMDRVFQVVR